MHVEDISRITHEANRAYCLGIGDNSQPSWDDAPDWQKDSARVGVSKILSGAITRPEQSHESWLEHKRADGWVYGPVKDPDAKTHPCMVPYGELPPEQRAKDAIFFGIVRAFMPAPTIDPREHIGQFFAWSHLPDHLAAVSRPFAELAGFVCTLSRNPERTVALRKILEGKDAAVRSVIAKDAGQ